MSSSIKVNYLYSIANTFIGLLFPLVTFPYVSRVLEPSGLGLYNFLNSIISYVTLFAGLGISLYATRKIAQHRDSLIERSKLTVEVFLLNVVTTFIAYSAVFILDLCLPRISEHRELFYVMSIGIILGPLSVNWFFQGIEDFKYITIRSLLVKCLSFVLLLTCVREKDDVIIYAIVSVIASVGNNLFNVIHLRKYISLHCFDWHTLRIWRHLKPSLVLFLLNIIISIYVNLDSAMLGFIKDDTAVGYYSIAGKLSHITLSMITTLGVVLLPRFSYLIKQNKVEEFDALARKSMDFTIGICLPIVAGFVTLAPLIVVTLFGEQYLDSILTLQIISPIILFASLTNVLGIQILYPKGKENIVILSTLGAAIVNFTLNWFLIPIYSQNGAAFSTAVAEVIVFVVQMTLGAKYFPKKIYSKNIFDYFIGTTIMIFAIFALLSFDFNAILQLIFAIILGIVIYSLYLYYRKNPLMISITSSLKQKFK